jgi:hypothetical protein
MAAHRLVVVFSAIVCHTTAARTAKQYGFVARRPV